MLSRRLAALSKITTMDKAMMMQKEQSWMIIELITV